MYHNMKDTPWSNHSQEEWQLGNANLASQTGHVYLPAQREPSQLDNPAAVRGLSPELKALQKNPNKLHFLSKQLPNISCSLAAGALKALGTMCELAVTQLLSLECVFLLVSLS